MSERYPIEQDKPKKVKKWKLALAGAAGAAIVAFTENTELGHFIQSLLFSIF